MANFVEAASAIAREAGALLLEHRGIGFELKGEFDLVTAADRASEKLIVSRLRETFPNHGIVGEEGAQVEMKGDYRWFVDPLDGTTNFAHGFPVWNVTLGLAKGDEVIAGVVFDPERNELFAAERGAGATLNGRKISVSKAATLEDSLLATGFPSRRRHLNVNIHFYYQVSMLTHGIRRAGAAAIDLAWTACGRLEGFWEFGLNPWDMAAGSLLVQEAGGKASGMKGEPLDVYGPHLLVTNTLIHDELLGVFREIFDGKLRHTMPGLEQNGGDVDNA